MSDVLRFNAPGPWITRDLKPCVLASDYDALLQANRDCIEHFEALKADYDVLTQINADLQAQVAQFKPAFILQQIRAGNVTPRPLTATEREALGIAFINSLEVVDDGEVEIPEPPHTDGSGKHG